MLYWCSLISCITAGLTAKLYKVGAFRVSISIWTPEQLYHQNVLYILEMLLKYSIFPPKLFAQLLLLCSHNTGIVALIIVLSQACSSPEGSLWFIFRQQKHSVWYGSGHGLAIWHTGECPVGRCTAATVFEKRKVGHWLIFPVNSLRPPLPPLPAPTLPHDHCCQILVIGVQP